MKLAIDAMSGDLGSGIVVDSCLNYIKTNPKDELFVIGKIEELTALNKFNQITLIDAREVLEMTENIFAIRRKKEASIVKAIMMAKNDEVDAVVSCCNTGIYYATAMLFLKRIKGIEKSCLMGLLPTLDDKGVIMLDVGANAENTANQLKQFAIMANVYAHNVKGILSPRIGLLNIGSEDHKGTQTRKEAYQLLHEMSDLNFVGNIEGSDILTGVVDVVVTDGFSGNIALKTMEGSAKILMKGIKTSFLSSVKSKLGALLVKDSLVSLAKRFDARSVGGALMIGFRKPVIKAHGASDAFAFLNAMYLASDMVKSNVIEKMKEGLE